MNRDLLHMVAELVRQRAALDERIALLLDRVARDEGEWKTRPQSDAWMQQQNWNAAPHHWNDASGLPQTLRPVEPRTREVECPRCHGRTYHRRAGNGHRVDCPVCTKDGVYTGCGVVDAIAWELDGIAPCNYHGDEPELAAGFIARDYQEPGVWLWRSAHLPAVSESEYIEQAISSVELARRLAPIWHRVREGTVEMQPVAVERGTVLDLDGERNARQTHWMRGGSHWQDVPRYNGAERVAAIMCANDVADELRRRQQADRMVLSSGRVVERAPILEQP